MIRLRKEKAKKSSHEDAALDLAEQEMIEHEFNNLLEDIEEKITNGEEGVDVGADVLNMLDDICEAPTMNYRYPKPRYRGRRGETTSEESSSEEETAHKPYKESNISPLERVRLSNADREKLDTAISEMERTNERGQALEQEIKMLKQENSKLLKHIKAENSHAIKMGRQANEDAIESIRQEQYAAVDSIRKECTAMVEDALEKQESLKAFCFEKVGKISVDMKKMNNDIAKVMDKFRSLEKEHESILSEYKKIMTNSIKKSELDDIRCEQKFFEEKFERRHRQNEKDYVKQKDVDQFQSEVDRFRAEVCKRQDELESYSVQELTKLFKNEDIIRKHYEQIIEILELEEAQASLEPHSVFKPSDIADEEESSSTGEATIQHAKPRKEGAPLTNFAEDDLAKLGKLPSPRNQHDNEISYEDRRFEKALSKAFSSEALYKYWNPAGKH